MTSALQSQTARINGAKSGGPVSDEGKQRAAKNAQRHGVCARQLKLTDPAEQQAFDTLEADLQFTYRATETAQKAAVHQLAVAMWRQRILDDMEMRLMDAIMAGDATAQEGGDGLPSMNSLYRYRNRIDRDIKQAKEAIRELQEERAKAFEAKLEKAKEFSQLTMLTALQRELGEAAFASFRSSVINEPKPTANDRSEQPKIE